MIMSGANGSGIMSVYERTDVDYEGTDKVTDLERSIGEVLVHAGGGRRTKEGNRNN